MNVWDGLRSRLAGFWQRRNPEEDLDRELQSHLELEAEEQEESGLRPKDAHYAARRAFGNTTLVKEDLRAIGRGFWLEQFARHVKYAARSLRKSPGFAIVAILTLALGIGANTAIFSAIDALMLRPLPFTDADQLVRIYSIQSGMSNSFANPDGPSAPDVRDFEQRSRIFQKTVVYDTWGKNVSFGDSAGEPEQMHVGLVPGAYFEILDIHPTMGRLFTEEEAQPGKNFVAAISERLWRNRFAADPSILGRRIRINGEPYTIVAVMPDVIPAWVEPGRQSEIWTPFAFPDAWLETSRGGRGFAALGRLKPGVPLEQAQADLSAIAAALAAEHPVDQGVRVVVRRLADTRAGALRPMLFLLMGAVSLILLISCVNLANLLLARNSSRQRELAVRAALGSARGGLVTQLLVETLLLSLIGAAAGLVLAKLGIAGVMRMHPKDLPQLVSIGIDWRVLMFTLLDLHLHEFAVWPCSGAHRHSAEPGGCFETRPALRQHRKKRHTHAQHTCRCGNGHVPHAPGGRKSVGPKHPAPGTPEPGNQAGPFTDGASLFAQCPISRPRLNHPLLRSLCKPCSRVAGGDRCEHNNGVPAEQRMDSNAGHPRTFGHQNSGHSGGTVRSGGCPFPQDSGNAVNPRQRFRRIGQRHKCAGGPDR